MKTNLNWNERRYTEHDRGFCGAHAYYFDNHYLVWDNERLEFGLISDDDDLDSILFQAEFDGTLNTYIRALECLEMQFRTIPELKYDGTRKEGDFFEKLMKKM